MPDVSIQFYALPSEVVRFATDVSKAHNLHVVAMTFFPFQAIELDSTTLSDTLNRNTHFKRLVFTLQAPIMPVSNELEFNDNNPDRLRLEIGTETESGLEESWLEARTENREAFAVWKNIATKLKEVTEAGVTAVNRQSGASAFYKSGRYTRGAKTLEDSGVKMLPPQGPNGPKIVLGLIDTTT